MYWSVDGVITLGLTFCTCDAAMNVEFHALALYKTLSLAMN